MQVRAKVSHVFSIKLLKSHNEIKRGPKYFSSDMLNL